MNPKTKRNDIHETVQAIRKSKRKRDTYTDPEYAANWSKYPKFCKDMLEFTQEDLAKDMYRNGIYPEVHVIWSRQLEKGLTEHVWQFSAEDVIRVKYGRNTIRFDGYDGHEHILFDKFDPNNYKISPSNFFQYTDIYPVQLPVRAGFKWRLAKHIWITSNKPPLEWWPSLTDGRRCGLLRRLTDVTEIPSHEA